MPPMHSTPRPPPARAHLAADQTLNLSFPPKTPGGTRLGGMDDWLDGIDLSAEIEFEEEVLTGFGERRGNLFAVDDIQGLQAWQPVAAAEEPGRTVNEPTVEPSALQLPTPSPEPGALPLPLAQAPRLASSSTRVSRNAVASSSMASPRLKSSRAASDALRTRDQPPRSTAQVDQQPVTSGSRPRPTVSLQPPSSSRTRATRSRSPVDGEPSSSRHIDSVVAARPKAALPRPTVRRSRSRSPEVHAAASRPRPSTAPSVASGPTRLPGRRPSTALLSATSAAPAPAATAARPLPTEPQAAYRQVPGNGSIRSFAFNHSRSFSFSCSVDEPAKDDFFARRLRDSYVGPVGITGLAASSSPPSVERDDSESVEQGISRLREEIQTRPRSSILHNRSNTPLAPRTAAVHASSHEAPRSPSPVLGPSPAPEPSHSRRQSAGEAVLAFFFKYLVRSGDPKDVAVAATPTSSIAVEERRSTTKRARPRSPSPPPAKRSREATTTSTASSSSVRAPFGEKARGDGNGRVSSVAGPSSRATGSKSASKARTDPGRQPLPASSRSATNTSAKRVTKPRPFVFQPLSSDLRPPAPPAPASRSGKPAGFVPSFQEAHNALTIHAEARAAALAAQKAKLAAEREAASKALFSCLEERMAKRGQWEEEIRQKEAEKEARRKEEEIRRLEREAREIREERRRTIVRARPVPDMYRGGM